MLSLELQSHNISLKIYAVRTFTWAHLNICLKGDNWDNFWLPQEVKATRQWNLVS